MELRKLQQTGGADGTYLISLPKDWVNKSDLKRGDVLYIIERGDGSLVLSPQAESINKLTESTIPLEQNIRRSILSAYLLGFDKIKVTSNTRLTPEERENVKKIVRRLVGVEIVEESSSEILLQALIAPTGVQIDQTFRRIYLLANKMHKDALVAFFENDIKLAQNVIERDDEVDRFYFLAVRQLRAVIQKPSLSERMNVSPVECLDYRVLAKSLESLADRAVEIAEKVLLLETYDRGEYKQIFEPFKSLNEFVVKMHQQAFNAVLNKDPILADKILVMRKQFLKQYEKVETVLVKQTPKQPIDLFLDLKDILEIEDIISEIALDIADLVSE
ncbi:phosphate uptake regulator PhoU [Candidatus Borrarchaeum sp.]|uniref:phosphate uptake regulator PhoU n=1 Tax=Candidatus Borrarchaeum sp. TaxID=2846742 RepID=UPI00257F565D|nr:phosphate uptake regulator PhoU [Candidatus Borrarchaeum sp.]